MTVDEVNGTVLLFVTKSSSATPTAVKSVPASTSSFTRTAVLVPEVKAINSPILLLKLES